MSGQPIPTHTAFIYLLVTVAASDGKMAEDELSRIGALVRQLNVFAGYNRELLIREAQDCAAILQDEDGFETILGLAAQAIPERLTDTAYLAACEVAGVDGRLDAEERRVLDRVRSALGLDRLLGAALERAAAARRRQLPA
jgi:tellurite resistance protein